ncbi:monocarboxylate transporter 9-like [Haemaphysalis longicornis]
MATTAVPIDVAWSVAVLAFLVAMLSAVVVSNGPVIFVLIMEEFNASHEAASWVPSASSIVTHLGGFIVALLELRFSLYQITFMAVTLLWISLLASGFATSITWITIALVVYGGAAGVVLIALSIYVVAYFDRYRAIASGVKFGGWAAAGLVFPMAFEAFLSTYGFKGAFIICAGVCMHCTPLVMLFKNPPIITWRRNKTQSPLSHEIKSRATSASKYCFTKENIQQTNGIEAENQSAPERSEVNLRLQKAVRCGVKANGVSTEGNEPTPNNKSKAVWKAPQSVLDSRSRKSFFIVCGPLRKKIFYAFVPAFIICDYDDMVSQLSIVDYTMDKGWEREDATSLIMCLSVGSLIGRLLLPLLADFKFLTRSALMAACYSAVAAVFLAMPHVYSFHGILLLCVVSGAAVGCSQSLKPVLVADYLGAGQIAPAMGVTGLIMLPLHFGNPAIVGFFRDGLGSYDNYYRLVAGLNVIVVVILLAIVLYEMRKKRGKVVFA